VVHTRHLPRHGKELQQKNENEAFVGSPTLTIPRMTEESDVVIAKAQFVLRSARRDF
jgi:hypothetical protein